MAERDYIDELEEHSYDLWKLKDDLRKLVDDLRNEHAAVWHGGRTEPRAELWKAKGAKEAADRLETVLNE